MARSFIVHFVMVVLRCFLGLWKFLSRTEFKIAQSQEDLNSVFRFCWEVYGGELNYFNPSDYKEKMHSDKYDDYSIIFMAKKGQRILGTIRLILDSPLGFYIERDFPITPMDNIERSKVAEISRFIVSKDRRGGLRLVSITLLVEALFYAKKISITHCYALMSAGLADSFKKFAVPIIKIEPGVLTPEQTAERSLMSAYYDKVNPNAYLIDIQNI